MFALRLIGLDDPLGCAWERLNTSNCLILWIKKYFNRYQSNGGIVDTFVEKFEDTNK